MSGILTSMIDHLRQLLLQRYLLASLGGLAILVPATTKPIVAAGTTIKLDPRPVGIAGIGVSFFATWFLRKGIVLL